MEEIKTKMCKEETEKSAVGTVLVDFTKKKWSNVKQESRFYRKKNQ